MQLQKATRKKVKIRMSLASPTGFGKTIGALMIAYGITNDWEKIAVIDTENDSASLYANHKVRKGGFVVGEFQTISLAPPFSPERYSQAIKMCEDAGIEVIIIDSITHVWKGQGGLIESNNQLGGSFQSWAKTTPRYQKWLDSILQSKCHVITTNRKKQAYNIIQENGKTKVEKRGMDDEIRDGYDYEMTVAFEIANENHLAFASKDRTGLFADQPDFIINTETGRMIKEWCENGEAVEPKEEIDYAPSLRAATTLEELKSAWEAIPTKEDRAKYESVKDEVKEKLTPKSSPTEQKEMDPAENSLRSAKVLDELAEAFKKLSPADKKKWKDLKDELKGKLPEKMEEAA